MHKEKNKKENKEDFEKGAWKCEGKQKVAKIMENSDNSVD
jgi:hypothetical protein